MKIFKKFHRKSISTINFKFVGTFVISADKLRPPQSLRHVKEICKFRMNFDSCNAIQPLLSFCALH